MCSKEYLSAVAVSGDEMQIRPLNNLCLRKADQGLGPHLMAFSLVPSDDDLSSVRCH